MTDNQNSSLPPTNSNSKSNRFWLFLPWLLLLIVLLVGFWLFSNANHLFNKQAVDTSSKATEVWQPPKSVPVVDNSNLDKAEPISSYNKAVKVASQSVVNIYTTQKMESHPYIDDPILRRFYEYHGVLPQQESDNTNLGSGVIVSENGYIITNAHVINKADNIIVALNDGRKVTAKVIGSDPESDLAVIKVELTGLKPLGFREKPIHVGDVVLAIGNPFGVGQTVTQGIISATGRTGLGINTFEDFIQTDAAINPGNSGGALVDAYGQLVGINTAIFSRSGGSMGIGFAIPTNAVSHAMQSIIKYGKVRRGWLGIELQGRIEDPTKLENSKGIVVMNVMNNGPAFKAGLQRGDIILAIDGIEMNDANSLIQYVARKSPESTVTAKIRRNNQETEVNIILSERQTQQELAQLEKIQQKEQLEQQNGSVQQIPPELLDLFNNR